MNIASSAGLAATHCPMSTRRVLPADPYNSAIPYSRNPVEKEPSKKYFTADSAPLALRRFTPASTYTAIDISSIPRNTNMRSRAAANTIMPAAAKSISTGTSGLYARDRACSASSNKSDKPVPSSTIKSIAQRKPSPAIRSSAVPGTPSPQEITTARPTITHSTALRRATPAVRSPPSATSLTLPCGFHTVANRSTRAPPTRISSGASARTNEPAYTRSLMLGSYRKIGLRQWRVRAEAHRLYD